MKLHLDPSHLEMPLNVMVAVSGCLGSIALAAWQVLGEMVAQIPTPDQVSGWQPQHVYLCACIIFASTIVCMARWIDTKLLQSQAANTAALKAVAAALERWDQSMERLVTPAVKHALDEAFKPDIHRPLAAGRKRGEPADT